MIRVLLSLFLLAVPLAALAQAPPHAGEALLASVVAYDEDVGDALVFRFVWETIDLDADPVATERRVVDDVPGVLNAAGDYEATDTLPEGTTQKQETWRVTVWAWCPGEYMDDAETVRMWSEPMSASVTIRGRAPKIRVVTLEPVR